MEVKPTGFDVHEYVWPLMPEAPIEAGLPAHTVWVEPAFATGNGLTEITTELELLQPVAVTFSVRV